MDFSRIIYPKNCDIRECTPVCRNFCHFWIIEISELSEFLKIFSENSIFQDFEGRFFQGRRCPSTKIFFWGDRPYLGVKRHGRPKSRTGPPRGVINIFSPPRSPKIRKASFFTNNGLALFFPKKRLVTSPGGYFRPSQICFPEELG